MLDVCSVSLDGLSVQAQMIDESIAKAECEERLGECFTAESAAWLEINDNWFWLWDLEYESSIVTNPGHQALLEDYFEEAAESLEDSEVMLDYAWNGLVASSSTIALHQYADDEWAMADYADAKDAYITLEVIYNDALTILAGLPEDTAAEALNDADAIIDLYR